ncbi:MAG: transporter substrate-binding domain-containing protein [Paraglaciecola sp.]|uniref:substrate-binding periplasmic protein n=1 Tax=Paraglaciecola sp. TaxID=1920173 RepID=UPI003298A3BF
MIFRSLMLMIFFATTFPQSLMAKDFVAHCRNYPPDLYFQKNQCLGAVPDLVNDIFEELGHNIFWVKAPWLRSLKDAKEGRVDILVRHSMTPERASFLLPIKYEDRTRQLLFFKSPALQSDITSYEDLQKVVVGAIHGVFYSPQFSAMDTRRVIFVEETEQLVSMLALNRIDIAVTSESHNRESFDRQFEKSDFTETFYNPHYISIPKSSPAMEYYDEVADLMAKYRELNKIEPYFEKHNLKLQKSIPENTHHTLRDK